jgi:hypothetical protein
VRVRGTGGDSWGDEPSTVSGNGAGGWMTRMNGHKHSVAELLDSLAHSPTHSPTHSLTHSLTHSPPSQPQPPFLLLQHRFINSQTYGKRRTNERWTVAETNRFYHALACFGTDFTAIAKLFPGRDR